MFGSESFHGNPQFHGCISVDGDELVVLQLNDIGLLPGKKRRYGSQFAGLIWQKYGYGKDSIPLD